MRNSTMGALIGLGLLVVGLVLAVEAGAQMGNMMGGPQGQGMQNMSSMMHDMGDQMVSLSGQMSHGNLSSAQQKQMAERMRTMAIMMDQMSGMMGKGMMMDAGHQKQMSEMRHQMDQMKKQSGNPPKK